MPAELKVDGQSFFPQLRGEAGHPREWSYCWFSKDGKTKAHEWVRTTRYKLYRTGAFYDLSRDVLNRYRDARLADVPQHAKKAARNSK